jgi:hypothetical protein
MKNKTLPFVFAIVLVGTPAAQKPKITSLISKELTETPGSEGVK